MEFKKYIKNGVEYRFDPLTGIQCRINPERARRPRQTGDGVEFIEIANRTKGTCPFCPERVEEKTPLFASGEWKGRRIKRGETTIIPNLNPFGENHAVGIISHFHFLDLDEFSAEMLKNNLIAAREYILSTFQSSREAVWPVYMWNYMPPSAGSIVHPHSQILVESEPLPVQVRTLERCREYLIRNGRNYWEELFEEESNNRERFIYGDDCLFLIASFAPRGFNEVQFTFHKETSLAEIDEKHTESFVRSLIRVLEGFKRSGVGSFNLVLFSGPLDRRMDYYRLHARLISRPYPRGVYTSDTGPFERLCDAWVIDTLPEKVAENLKALFP